MENSSKFNAASIKYIITAAIILFAMYYFLDDVRYFFSSKTPIDLGGAMEIKPEILDSVKDGDFVKIKGIRSIQGGNMQKSVLGKPHMIYYFIGSTKFVVLERMSADEEKNAGAVYVTIEGRLFKFKTNKAANRSADFFRTTFGLKFDDNGAMIEADLLPRTDYFSLSIFLLLIVMLAIDIFLAFATIGRKPDETPEEEEEIDFDEHQDS